MRGTEFFTYGGSQVAEGHTAQEYADRQKQDSLNKAGKIDVDSFLKTAYVERCFVETRGANNSRQKSELDKNNVYTIWFNEDSGKWLFMSSQANGGEEK